MYEPPDNLPPLTGQDDELPDDERGPFAPGEQVGTYEVVDEIGRGGMCIVYKATDSALKRTVALKVLRPSLARRPKIARRFHHESVLSANLSHEGIAPIYSLEYHPPGLPYFAMELVEGETIDSLVRAGGPMAPRRAVEIARHVADTLAYAHSRDVIHRDITPRNILVDQASGRVRVVDFGIAQDTEGTIHETYVTQESSFGTLAFMSPEQNLSGRIDRRSDVFSLGMTLYFMLTGRTAWAARNRAELALAFRMQSPAPPSAHNPSIAPELDAIVLRMIETDPDQRYANCADASAVLEAALADEPDEESQSSRRWLTPARAWAALLLVAAVIALHVVLGSSDDPLSAGNTASPDADTAPQPAGPPSDRVAEGFSLFGPIPAAPSVTRTENASLTDPDAFAAEVVDAIEVPLPPKGWTPPNVPADGSDTWLKGFTPPPSQQGNGNDSRRP
jgi:serine/threonine-protein kinase